MDVFLVVIILNPTQKARHDEGAVPMIISGPHAIMAKDATGAAMKAHRFIPEEHAGKAESLIEIKILPFQAVGR